MITLTKLNGANFSLNAELIESIETTPDTVITTQTGKKYVVQESEEIVIQKVITYKRLIYIPV
ncbi:flagellar FlbD family protein [Niameybacter massiliensis]|uniref:Flagellar FlbD family protein n=1 Tax=Holtiella tumoricola TaxID=3018743 RepID=A0AA42DP79_9FIRM|nr:MULTISPECIES: flagellar FlbD family protein [Lachnospirales]MDA3732593.1 flagellar FlbD family protein [Holtiella tumoricola]